MKKRLICFLACIACLAGTAAAQRTVVQGLVTDSITGEGLPYVSVRFPGTNIGAQTDESGSFRFSTDTPGERLSVSYVGYATKQVPVVPGQVNRLHIELAETTVALEGVVVKPKRERYRRRGNPAVEFVRKVIDKRDANDPRRHDYYSYDRYERITIARNDYQPKPRTDGKTGKFDFLEEFVDTLDAGTTVLPLSEKERKERVFYRRQPRTERSLLEGSQSAGLDEVLAAHGYVRQGDHYTAVRPNCDTIALFCHFGVTCIMLSHLFCVAPVSLSQHFAAAPSSVTTVYTEDRREGIAQFRCTSFGDTSHLYLAHEPPSFSARFCETFKSEERHD